MRFGPVIVVGLFLANQAAFAQEQEERARLVGLVTDRLVQAPAVAAQISVVGAELRTLTNEEGWFTLDDLPPGEH
ncbi:MAG: hypothetical protein PVJ64_17015, partial [Gemmatimonadales bacterium]